MPITHSTEENINNNAQKSDKNAKCIQEKMQSNHFTFMRDTREERKSERKSKCIQYNIKKGDSETNNLPFIFLFIECLINAVLSLFSLASLFGPYHGYLCCCCCYSCFLLFLSHSFVALI